MPFCNWPIKEKKILFKDFSNYLSIFAIFSNHEQIFDINE